MNFKRFGIATLILFALVVNTPAQEGIRFNNFKALTMDRDVVTQVLNEGNDIYVMVQNEYRGATFTVRLSNENLANYRSWLDGKMDRQVSVYQSNSKNRLGYTYRINTSAMYVEYWMDSRLVLHLERTR